MSSRWRSTLVLLATILGLPRCGFVESAGDIEVGSPTIPKVSYDLKWPKVDDLLGTALNLGSLPLPGEPTSLQSATLAHVQGLMAISGDCHRVLVQEKVAATSGSLRHLSFALTNCGDPSRCVSRCQGFQGVKVEARVQVQLLDDAKAARLKKAFPKSVGDAVVQIRARFRQLSFYQTESGKPVDIARYFANYTLGLSSPGGGDDTPLVRQMYLARITPQTPQRFELDPGSPFTRTLQKTVLTGQTQWIEVFQRIDIAQRDLYSVRLGGSGVQIEFQPELVVNSIEVGKEFLK